MKKALLPLAMLATALTMSAYNSDKLYVTGSATTAGWNPEGIEMTKVENNVFTWTGELSASGEFKFTTGEGWENTITCDFNTETEQNVIVQSGKEYDLYVRPTGDDGKDNKFQVSVTGEYTLTVDLNDMIMAVTLEEEIVEPLRLYIVGDATAGGWSQDNAMNQPLTQLEDGTYAWGGELKEGNFRFLVGHDWWPSYSVPAGAGEVTEENPEGLGDLDVTVGEYDIFFWENEPNPNVSFKVTNPGLYNINLDIENLKMYITERAEELYIIGNALNGGPDLWELGWAQPFTPTGNPHEFVWNGYLYKLGYYNDDPSRTATAEFRFISQSNEWNPGFVAAYVQDQIQIGGTYEFLPSEGNADMKYTVKEDGWYKLIANTETLTLEVLQGSPEDQEGGVVAVGEDGAVVSLNGNVLSVEGGVADIYDIHGRVIAKGVSSATLPAGICVAVVNGAAHKLIVR